MSAILTWRSAFAAVVLLAGCASGAPDAAVERDVQLATRGDTVLAWADGRTYYFSNAPAPICFAFDVPGEWHFGRQPGVVRRTDEQALVGALEEARLLEASEASGTRMVLVDDRKFVTGPNPISHRAVGKPKRRGKRKFWATGYPLLVV